MQLSPRSTCTLALVLPLALALGQGTAKADTFSIQYYEVPTGSADFYNASVSPGPEGISYNYVAQHLGPDGLPVFVGVGNYTASGTVIAPNSVYLNSSNEILYWSPTNPSGGHVLSDGSGTITLSSTPVSMFAPGTSGPGTGGSNNGTGNDQTYEETAILTGYFTVPTGATDTVTFDIGADDMAFAFVDGSLVESLGGLHAVTSTPSASFNYGAGTHTIQIFYADRETGAGYLSFTDNGNFQITPAASSVTPEPASLLLLSTGLLGVTGTVRRRRRS